MLDEPTAALGVAQTAEVLNLIERVRDRGLGVIIISHNMEDVRAVADRIVVLRLGRNNGVFTRETSHQDLVAAITGASVVLVEAGPEEEKALKAQIARDPSTMVITEGPLLNQQLPPEVWAQLSDAMSARGIPAFMTAKFKPWYVLTLLSIPPCAMLQMTSEPEGLDRLVIKAAQEAGVPVRALEPYDTLFKIFGNLTEAELTEMLVSTLAIEPQGEDYFTTLVDGYFAGESRAAWELMRFISYDMPGYTHAEVDAEFARMEEIVAASRNRAWIPVLTEAASKGPVFAAFGALHLSGQDGVLNLLQKQGFTLEELKL